MVTHHLQKLTRSFRTEYAGKRVGDVPGGQPIRLTIILKPHVPIDTTHPIISRAEFGKRHGTRQDVVDRLIEYAEGHGLQVDHADAATHIVRLSGTYAQARSAFEPEGMGLYQINGRNIIARDGHLAVPADLAEHVVAVTGFDQRQVAWPHFRIRPRTAPSNVSYDPAAVAARYGFPPDVTGANQTIALIELGGGYDPARMSAYFAARNIHRTGTLEAVPVDGAQNQPAGDANGPDGEVQLDIEVAGSVAPAANLAVYFASNAGSGFLDAVAAAVHDTQRTPSVISISWGGPETGWAGQDVDAMDQLFQTAASIGITVCAASGDSGASNGEEGMPTVDFPASSPHVLGCGGTKLPRQGPETAWNDGAQGGATGGGYSTHFNRPDWQGGNTQTGRGVPDVAGDADPATGYNVTIDGQDTVVGGTSAVAPLWAGLIALINQSVGKNSGFINPALYANASAMTDIVSGNNNGYHCGPGWDPVTGLGTPKGSLVLAAIKGNQVVA